VPAATPGRQRFEENHSIAASRQIGFSAVRAFMPYDGTACALRFLRQPNRPMAPMPVANSGRAAGDRE